MKIKSIALILSVLVFSNCSTPQYFSNNDSSVDFSGKWLFKNNQDIILTIQKTENGFYSLNFDSPDRDWEAIGYYIDNELLAIFKYTDKDDYGYVTFNLESPNKLSYHSMNSNGSFRSKNFYTKLKSP